MRVQAYKPTFVIPGTTGVLGNRMCGTGSALTSLLLRKVSCRAGLQGIRSRGID